MSNYLNSLISAYTKDTQWNNPHRILFRDGSSLVDSGGCSLEQVVGYMIDGSLQYESFPSDRKVFVTSDTHFGHLEVASMRGFRSAKEHDEWVVQKWNSVVGENDIVIHLGDVTKGKTKPLSYLDSCNGRKILIAGNHDLVWTRGDNPQGYQQYLEYFDAIVTKGSIWSVELNWLFSHLPIETRHEGDNRSQFVKHRPAAGTDGSYVICGHVHSTWNYCEKNLNVGVDIYPKPVSIFELYHKIEKLGLIHTRFNPEKWVLGAECDLTRLEMLVLGRV